MKSFVFAILASAILGSLSAAPRVDGDLADRVQQVIDGLLSAIPGSIELKDESIDIPSTALGSGKITVNEISLSGVKDLNTKLNYDAATSRLDYVLNFEDIAVVVDFSLHFQGLINVDHQFSLHVDLKDLKNEGYAVVSSDPKEVTDFNLIVSLGKSDIVIKGLLNNDQLSDKVSQVLSENVAKIINEVNPVIAPFFSRVVKDIINIALKIEH